MKIEGKFVEGPPVYIPGRCFQGFGGCGPHYLRGSDLQWPNTSRPFSTAWLTPRVVTNMCGQTFTHVYHEGVTWQPPPLQSPNPSCGQFLCCISTYIPSYIKKQRSFCLKISLPFQLDSLRITLRLKKKPLIRCQLRYVFSLTLMILLGKIMEQW